MSLKKIKLLDVFIIFFLCFLFHFIYTWFPNSLFSIFFPVNESIWEHMKIIFSAIIIYGIFDYILLKKFKIPFNNFIINLFLSGVFSIVFFLIIYLPFFYIVGENIFLNILILFISIGFSQFVSYYVLNSENYDLLNYISLIGIIFVYILFGILTYYPIYNDLFYDQKEEKYGINIYDI